jgi:RNA polymerase sigma factor (sigma-70 family)
METSDSQRIARCLAGQPQEYRYLVNRYQAPLLGYLARQSGSYDELEDVVQEAFVRAYFNLAKLKNPDAFYPWLVGIARRVRQEKIRMETKQRQAKETIRRQKPPVPFSTDFDLEKAVAELPGPYQRLIRLRYFAGLSCREVAQQLRIPFGTVTKQLSRAYAMLRRSLFQR